MADGDGATIQVETHGAVGDIPAAEWDRCADPAPGAHPRDPFTCHAFLCALEQSGSVGPGTGWRPLPLTARDAQGRVIAAAPLYAKHHSQGEYVFDHAWAEAWENAGGDYYPKLQIAAPFSPVAGPRFLTAQGADPQTAQAALLHGAMQLCARNSLSSLHATFCTEAEWRRGGEMGLLQRTDQQFHWLNEGYRDFDDFLSRLASRKRKALKKERAAALSAVEIHAFTGADLRAEHWDAFWTFYQDTGARKWGRPYLTRAFFDLLGARMADHVLLLLARRDGRWVAGALNLIGAEALYGRYWGCVEDIPFLHFELCYHQAMEHAIRLGLARVEAGAQGAHKLARGYLPAPTFSLHHIPHAGFRNAVEDYLRRERAAVAEHSEFLREMGPFRKEAIR